MSEMTVGIRDLKARLSEYLRRVRAGEAILITDHGKPVGRIIPAESSLETRVEALLDAGLIAWNGNNLSDIDPPAINKGDKLASDIVIEMRE